MDRRSGTRLALWLLIALCTHPQATADVAAERGLCQSGPAETAASYDLSEQAPGRWTGSNPLHRFNASFSEFGVRVTPETPGRASWEWSFNLTNHGFPESLREAGAGWPVPLGNRVDLPRERIHEWFLNSMKGLQHGVDLPEEEAAGLVVIDFSLQGTLTPKIAADGQSVTFIDTHGTPTLAYRALRAFDGAGLDVAVRWTTGESDDQEQGLRLILDSADHVGPIHVRGLIVAPKPSAAADAPSSASSGGGSMLAPGNDLCPGAEVVPGGGPFPYTSVAYDITDATTASDPPTPSCQSNISRSIWFKFTPSASGPYNFSLCSDATATTVEDTVVAIYSSTGACAGLTQLAGGCDDDSCSIGDLQSILGNIPLISGTTYYVVAWKFDTTAPLAGEADIQLQVSLGSVVPPPPNDQCSGATVIPGAGPFPYLTSTTTNITGATTTGDPPAPSCQPAVSRSVWYAFTPTTSGSYTFSTCADATTGTTVDDTVMALYAAGGSCSGLVQVAGGCNDDGCVTEAGQSSLRGLTLTAGTPYNLVVWQFDTPPPTAGNTAVQVRVIQTAGPGNDTCAAAVPLTLNAPVAGTTVGTVNDYQLPTASTCFTGFGQSVTTAPGGEAVFSFTAPAVGSYSFRVTGYDPTRNAALYVAGDCPSGTAPLTVTGCLGAANRNTGGVAEEIKCVSLTSGQQVYLYADEVTATAGSAFTVEATACTQESEPNGTTAQAGPLVCGIEGAVTPTGEADFFSLGTPSVDSRVFALVDGAAANLPTFRLRVTTTTDTLEYDASDNDIPFGSSSPNIAGTPLTGTASYLRINHTSTTQSVEPYRLYGLVQAPSSDATQEVEPNNTSGTATAAANIYFSGSLSTESDVDHFSFTAQAGELITLGLDLDPTRDNTPFNGALTLLDGAGTLLLIVNDTNAASSTTPGTGSQTLTSPASPAETLAWRIRSSGTYVARVSWSSGTAGDYLLSVARDCRIGPPTDLAVTQTDTPDPVAPGGTIVYVVTITNQGAAPTTLVTLTDDLPAGTTLISALPAQGTCSGSGPVRCDLGTITGGAATTVTISVSAPAAPGVVTNTARVSSMVIDPNPSNDLRAESTTVGQADSDGDGVPDTSDCAPLDPSASSVPGEATDLTFPSGLNTDQMRWAAPVSTGGPGLRYDVCRFNSAGDLSARVCVSSDQTATTATDASAPAGIFYYLVRSENVCGGNSGTSSNGTPHTIPPCP